MALGNVVYYSRNKPNTPAIYNRQYWSNFGGGQPALDLPLFGPGPGSKAQDYGPRKLLGTLGSHATWIGGDLKLDGTSGAAYVQFAVDPLYLAGATSLSVSIWLQFLSLPASTFMFIGGTSNNPNTVGGWQFNVDARVSPTQFKMQVATNASGSFIFYVGNLISDFALHHLLYTYNGSTGAIYLDGRPQSVTSSGTNGPFRPRNGACNLGSVGDNNVNNLNAIVKQYQLLPYGIGSSPVGSLYTRPWSRFSRRKAMSIANISNVIGSSFRFRRTFSDYGTRIGSRQAVA